MRIVSLLPAATEWICAIGGGEQLVGRSHACDYPGEIHEIPAVSKTTTDFDLPSPAIDSQVKHLLTAGLSVFDVDWALLKHLKPDLILTQSQCRACAVSTDQLGRTLSDRLGHPVKVLDMAPTTLKQVLTFALALGHQIGRATEAMNIIATAEAGLKRLRERLGANRDGTLQNRSPVRVACIEWIDPLMIAGHWVPDVVEMAGGSSVLSVRGGPSTYVSIDSVADSDPEAIAIIPCGFSLRQTESDLPALTESSGWHNLKAVQSGRVALFDGNAYFNRPGPRIYRAIHLMACFLHPGLTGDLTSEAADWEAVQLTMHAQSG